MLRTTLNIEGPVFKDLKRLQQREGKSMGSLVSELLALALAEPHARKIQHPRFEWVSQPMKARVDLSDKEAVQAALEETSRRTRARRR